MAFIYDEQNLDWMWNRCNKFRSKLTNIIHGSRDSRQLRNSQPRTERLSRHQQVDIVARSRIRKYVDHRPLSDLIATIP